MVKEKVHQLLNQQINKEFYSAYLYLDFSNYFKARGLDGFANWYLIQAQEERDHAMLFYTYLQNENMEVTLDAIAKPDKTFDNHLDVLKAGLEHEQYVTSLINDIYGAAYDVRDFRTMQFLPHWTSWIPVKVSMLSWTFSAALPPTQSCSACAVEMLKPLPVLTCS
ncbi:MAG: ferritin [Clostridia bacterium]|nr:ferritin [Clostridia bacterium]